MTTGWKILAALLLAAAAAWGWHAYTGHLVATGDAAGYARAQGEYTKRELLAVKAAREEEQRKTDDAQKEAERANKELAAMRADHDGAVAVGQRLRTQLAAAFRGCRAPAQPAAAGASAPADPAADLYADVQRRLEEAENGTIRFADEGRIAGLACERIYDGREARAVTSPLTTATERQP